jgi:predicted glutamine amidotransferase
LTYLCTIDINKKSIFFNALSMFTGEVIKCLLMEVVLFKTMSGIRYLSIPVLVLIFIGFFIKTSSACRMYGAVSGNLPDDMLAAHLITDPNSLAVLSNLHSDGWGIAHYQTYGDVPTIDRGAVRAWNDPEYTTVVNQLNLLEPNITLAHIRFCTGGCCDHDGDSIADPHPFYRTKNGKTWTFMHNGGVDYDRLYTLVGDEYLNANGPYGSGVPGCTTSDPYDPSVIGSELYFLLVLKNIEENNWNVVNGIVEAVMELINDGETGGMIFILSDGNTVWAFLRGSIPSYHTLYYEYNVLEGFSTVASEYPSTTQGDWQPMHNNELVVLTANAPPVIIDVTLYDGMPDAQDNCPATPNGPLLGTCLRGTIGETCKNNDDCGTGGYCSMNQEDTYPPQGNGIGDACDCEGDFNCDGNVDATDVTSFLTDFGRNQFNDPCTSGSPCNGDSNCDSNVDATDVTVFLGDFGRNQFNNPCPACVEADWCVY